MHYVNNERGDNNVRGIPQSYDDECKALFNIKIFNFMMLPNVFKFKPCNDDGK